MNKALASGAMILEADVNLEGYGTANQKPVPIMAHYPNIYSDNTLDQWLDAVLRTSKGIKLDFKSLEAVGPSLDLLSQRNQSRTIGRPVWVNADVLTGPNVPDFIPVVNGTGFLLLLQEKFPDVTISLGWKVAILPVFMESYTSAMVEKMYNLVKFVPQKVTFPVHALLVREGWQHISWLLSQFPTGTVHPKVNDLLFVRDNSHPSRVFYDIYEPTLSAFRQAAEAQGRVRRFYPGGDLQDYFYPATSTDRDTLPELLALLPGSRGSWGLYVRTRGLEALEAALKLLSSAYSQEQLFRPVWVSADLPQNTPTQQVGVSSGEVVSRVEALFPHVTLVLRQSTWPPPPPAGRSLRVALSVDAALLPSDEELGGVWSSMEGRDLLVEEE
ncbi:hypothetical protein CRUP_030588, partial [Coryphaenoides rupestris]